MVRSQVAESRLVSGHRPLTVAATFAATSQRHLDHRERKFGCNCTWATRGNQPGCDHVPRQYCYCLPQQDVDLSKVWYGEEVERAGKKYQLLLSTRWALFFCRCFAFVVVGCGLGTRHVTQDIFLFHRRPVRTGYLGTRWAVHRPAALARAFKGTCPGTVLQVCHCTTHTRHPGTGPTRTFFTPAAQLQKVGAPFFFLLARDSATPHFLAQLIAFYRDQSPPAFFSCPQSKVRKA